MRSGCGHTTKFSVSGLKDYCFFVYGQTNPIPAYGCAFAAERDGTLHLLPMAVCTMSLKLENASELYKLDRCIIGPSDDIPDVLAL